MDSTKQNIVSNISYLNSDKVDTVLSDVIFQIKAEIWTFMWKLQLLNIVE